jgi:hypothetical protein
LLFLELPENERLDCAPLNPRLMLPVGDGALEKPRVPDPKLEDRCEGAKLRDVPKLDDREGLKLRDDELEPKLDIVLDVENDRDDPEKEELRPEENPRDPPPLLKLRPPPPENPPLLRPPPKPDDEPPDLCASADGPNRAAEAHNSPTTTTLAMRLPVLMADLVRKGSEEEGPADRSRRNTDESISARACPTASRADSTRFPADPAAGA